MAPVSNDVGHSFFDINTLPVAMIERVEILRDGASATYGSQAVAGVANIVTRTEFERMSPSAIDSDGDSDIVEGSFDSGRGSPGSYRRAVANADGRYSPFQAGGVRQAREIHAGRRCAARSADIIPV